MKFRFVLQMRGLRGSSECDSRTQPVIEYSRLSTRMDRALDRIQFCHGTNISFHFCTQTRKFDYTESFYKNSNEQSKSKNKLLRLPD